MRIKEIILDPKRTMSVSFFLKACKLTQEQLIDMIKRGDFEGFDLNQLKNNLPTTEEVKLGF